MIPSPSPRLAVIVVAAGSGTRLQGGAPKAFVPLDRDSILRHSLRGVLAAPRAQVVVVVPDGFQDAARADVQAVSGDPGDGDGGDAVRVVVGGRTRQESVAAGLSALDADVDLVLVHDAARALTPVSVFERVIDALEGGAPAVIPAVPVVDTIKRVDENGVILAAVDRSELAAAQTPQGFRRDVLEAAVASADADHTDDAALVAAAGHDVVTVAGHADSFKITTAPDLDRARALVASRRPAAPRIGIGTDVHGFGGEGTLWLAGLEWPGEQGLSGHSDGDAVAHAIVDALLSAAGLGDIGTHFGTDRPEFSGAHAEAFLSHTVRLIEDAGWRVGNVSVQVQANRPRFAARRVEAEDVLSRALGGAPVSVSATTTDRLGFTGRTEGVAAFATALVLPL
ncbi:2-C-methyl-D-erythritol 4-phosphate cytidylyltransferase [Microbacterium testaceum]|uniref:2-C-methyl-D-erythritol 4-phosphate cytidylyltransferase n=1 Tax=Microbacterium testaceum TaxID=2033 RepID=UPI0007346A2E|nr:2-C-methyl-D-erythritol 4-phosphate cytidylyltransferase [Microbacterium testaceum]KTS02780.1 2-C-methyl-D-erythritol 2,4-cyclodiphosphate synthase [Microbacterium testaceum]